MKSLNRANYTRDLTKIEIMQNAIGAKDLYLKIACQLHLAHSIHNIFECYTSYNSITENTYSFPEWKIRYININMKLYTIFILKDRIYFIDHSKCSMSDIFAKVIKTAKKVELSIHE